MALLVEDHLDILNPDSTVDCRDSQLQVTSDGGSEKRVALEHVCDSGRFRSWGKSKLSWLTWGCFSDYSAECPALWR